MFGDRDGVKPVAAGTARAADLWEQIKSRLVGKIGSQGYENWVMRTAFQGAEGGTLRVVVPDQVTKDWMEQEYADDVSNVIVELSLPVQRVVYVPAPASAGASSVGDR